MFARPYALVTSFDLRTSCNQLDFSTRDGINVLRYAIKRLASDPEHPLSKDQAWAESVIACLGDDALDLQSLAARKQQSLGGNIIPLGLGDFFFTGDDPLHPDADHEDGETDEGELEP